MLMVNQLIGFGAGAVAAGDGIAATALCHFDGTNGDTTTTEFTGRTVTMTAGTQISNTQSKFGGTSLSVDGTAGHWAQIADHADFDFGTGDMTMEAFVYPTTLGTTRPVISIGGDAGGYVLYISTNTIGLYVNSTNQSASVTLTTGNWYHVAMSRASNVHRVFLNGVQALSYTNAWSQGTTTGVRIGGGTEVTSFSSIAGFVDECRIVRGTAVYTGNFTPPTVAFTGLP